MWRGKRRFAEHRSSRPDELRHGDSDSHDVDPDNGSRRNWQPGFAAPRKGTYIIATGITRQTPPVKYKVKLDDLIAINGWTLVNGQVPEFNNLAPARR